MNPADHIPIRLSMRPLFRGLPVPAIVQWFNGVPDFRVTDLDAWDRIARNRLCSLCGMVLRKLMWFVGGPECMEQHLFFDLPVHEDCGLYAFKVCPYLAMTTSSHNTAKPLPGTSEIITQYVEEVAAGRPAQMGFAAATSYTIGQSEKRQPLVQASDWVRGPFWFADRADAETYERTVR